MHDSPTPGDNSASSGNLLWIVFIAALTTAAIILLIGVLADTNTAQAEQRTIREELRELRQVQEQTARELAAIRKHLGIPDSATQPADVTLAVDETSAKPIE